MPFRIGSLLTASAGLIIAFLMVGVGSDTGPVLPAVACAIGAALAAVAGLRLHGKMAGWVFIVAAAFIVAGVVVFLVAAEGLGKAIEGSA